MRSKLIRITIKDPEQTISFLTNKDAMFRFVAGCSINPANLGELLMATETYQRGITAIIMAELMEFDKALKYEGAHFIQDAISAAQAKGKTLETTFQVIDESTAREAFQPRDNDLVVLDLSQHVIEATEGLQIPTSDEVTIHSGEELTTQTVTFVLPQDWTIKTITR